LDSVREGGEGRLLFTSNKEYFEVKVRHIARTRDRFCAIIKLANLTKDNQSENLGYLDEFLRRIYDVYERITLLDFREDSIRPLYTSTQEDLVSGRQDIGKLAAEFAEKYVFPDDRDKYIRLFDRKTTISRLSETSEASYSEVIRSSVRHGRYAWMEYTLLRIDKDKFYLLVRNVQGGVNSFMDGTSAKSGEGKLYSPTHLWNNLLRSGLLRLFWKDEQRRFIGASQAFLDYYGFPSIKAIAGKNDEEVGWHVHPEAYMNDEYQVIHEGATLRFMPGLCMNEGENKEILASKTPLYDDSGDIRGLLGFFIDRDMLNANDRRGAETARRDALTGLLNSRGIAEEAAVFRDEYYLRGVDFIRIHITINDFSSYNEQYGFDFGDKVLSALAHALKDGFGRTSAVGRYAGLEFVVLRQVKNREEVQNLRAKIKAIGDSVSKVDGVPVTLYLSVGFTLFSECPNLEDQTRNSELRLHADHDHSISAKSSLAHASEIFRLFDRLPFAYCVYHVSVAGPDKDDDTIICYVNRKFEEITGMKARTVFGRQVRELYPEAEEEWFTNIKRAALDNESVEGVLANWPGGKQYRYTACQIICSGYCVVIYQEEG
jgi:diguanylate cyclase (GGDEF)-like protein